MDGGHMGRIGRLGKCCQIPTDGVGSLRLVNRITSPHDLERARSVHRNGRDPLDIGVNHAFTPLIWTVSVMETGREANQ